MRKSLRITLSSVAAALLFTISLSAKQTPAHKPARIKLGTVAPKDSSFDKILVEMGQKWQKHDVVLKIYPGGTLGGEAEMVRRMKNGALDAGLLTVVGLSEIDDSVEALQSMPMMFRSLEEVDFIGEKLRPRLERRLRDKGFVVLFWADAGWVRFFSKSEILRPDDLKRTKLFTWAGDVEATDIYKAAGFRPVPLETNDILPSLQMGMINAVPLPPYVALATQVFKQAPHMLELNWAPLVGAFVITETAWNTFPPATQKALATAAADAGRTMKARNRLESDRAVEVMKKRDLRVHKVPPQFEAEWQRAAEQSYPMIRGRIVPVDLFDEVKRLLSEYRRPIASPKAAEPK